MAEIDPDGHQAILFRTAHNLAGAAGHASLVRQLTSLRRFNSPASKTICLLPSPPNKNGSPERAHFYKGGDGENRTPVRELMSP